MKKFVFRYKILKKMFIFKCILEQYVIFWHKYIFINKQIKKYMFINE